MYSACPASYSSLDSIVSNYNINSNYSQSSKLDYMIAAEPIHISNQSIDYENIKKEIYTDSYRPSKRLTQSYSHVTDDFLNPQRPLTAFIGKASEIKELVEDTFFKLTGKDFPDDVIVKILSADEMKKTNPANVQGFALNRKHLGLMSEIFIKEDLLDKVMLTLGHELGHVLTKRLNNDKNEEAKAFAFSIAWMKTIKQHNIGSLAASIQLDAPAKNGLHNVALDHVLELIKQKEPLDVWKEIINGDIE